MFNRSQSFVRFIAICLVTCTCHGFPYETCLDFIQKIGRLKIGCQPTWNAWKMMPNLQVSRIWPKWNDFEKRFLTTTKISTLTFSRRQSILEPIKNRAGSGLDQVSQRAFINDVIYANLAILATFWVFYWSHRVSLGHLGGLVAF